MDKVTIEHLTPAIRAKSSGTSLRSHLAVTAQVAMALVATAECPMSSAGVLVVAAALHDLGKVRQSFQDFLDSAGPWYCHEEGAPETIREFIDDSPSRQWLTQIMGRDLPIPNTESDVDDIVAFAVTHHGRRSYVPDEVGGRAVPPVTTPENTMHKSLAVTEFDLLYRYRPYGGAVILADQIASALQDGQTGLVVSVDIGEPAVASPLADLPDEGDAYVASTDPGLLPQGSGLQRLLLDGLRIGRVEAALDGAGWRLTLDRRRTVVVWSEI